MARKPKRLRNLRIREISLCEQGMNPASHIVLHKAADPEPAPAPTTEQTIEALKSASPEVLEIVKRQTEAHKKLLEDFKKMNEGTTTMTATDPNHFYNKALAEFAERRDLSIAKAAEVMAAERSDLLEIAYAKDQQSYIARVKADADRYQ